MATRSAATCWRFGVDLTGATGVCAACAASAFVAEAVVCTRGPGGVARCRTCGERLIVLVTIRGVTCVDMSGIAELDIET